MRGAPLFPLNSLMLHGIIYAKQAEHLNDDPGNDFSDEVRSYFGSGTQLQEMYITPALLRPATGTRSPSAPTGRAPTGDDAERHALDRRRPGKLEVYGWAAWSPEGWIVTLRNPSAHTQTFALDLQAALELPQDAPRSYLARDPFSAAATEIFTTKEKKQIALKPFEVRVIRVEEVTMSASLSGVRRDS